MKSECAQSPCLGARWVLMISVGLWLFRSTPLTAQTSPATLPDLKLSTCAVGGMFDLTVQDDGKVILCGLFSSVNNVPRTNLARLNPNGTLDLTWNPQIDGQVNSIVVSGTKIYLGGQFRVLDDPLRSGLVRVSAVDGSTDTGWGPKPINGTVYAIAVNGPD